MNQEIQNNFIVEPLKADLIMGKIVDENIKKQLDKSMDFFLKYYPARIKNVGEDAIAARELVWAFKDARDNAFEKVAEMTAEHLKKEYGDKLRNMAFVCVPTSNKDHYATRFSAFCKRVSELSGVENGFSHIVIMQSRMAVHEHRHGKKKCEVKPQLFAILRARMFVYLMMLLPPEKVMRTLQICWKTMEQTLLEVCF